MKPAKKETPQRHPLNTTKSKFASTAIHSGKPLTKEQEAENFSQLLQKLQIEQSLRELQVADVFMQMMQQEEHVERYR